MAGDSAGERLQGHKCPAATGNMVQGPAEFGVGHFFLIFFSSPTPNDHMTTTSALKEHILSISQMIIKSLLSTNAEGYDCEPLENAGYSTLILDKEFLFFVFLSPGAAIEESDSQHVALRHLSCINVSN